jgi:hydrogenase nickel incorporation protein HypA/HybF
MHELSIAQDMLNIALQTAEQQGAKRIVALYAKIGEWSTIEPDALDFAFEVLRRDTIAAEAVLHIERIPLACTCKNCGNVFQPEEGILICMKCGSRNLSLDSGREIALESIDIE